MGDVLRLSESNGGYDAFPVMSQFGYQMEKAYISSGDFEALVEGLFLATGIEQNLFIPSLTILNGFRSTGSGGNLVSDRVSPFAKLLLGTTTRRTTGMLKARRIQTSLSQREGSIAEEPLRSALPGFGRSAKPSVQDI